MRVSKYVSTPEELFVMKSARGKQQHAPKQLFAKRVRTSNFNYKVTLKQTHLKLRRNTSIHEKGVVTRPCRALAHVTTEINHTRHSFTRERINLHFPVIRTCVLHLQNTQPSQRLTPALSRAPARLNHLLFITVPRQWP